MSRKIDSAQIVVNRFVAHRVPRLRGEDDQREIRYSASVPELPRDTLDFFARRVKRTFSDAGQHVEVDHGLEAPKMPGYIRDYLTDEEPDLLETSRRAAVLLQEAQTASRYEDESLVATMDATIEGQRGLIMAKLEEEQGVEFEEASTDTGGTTLYVSINERLVLTDNTRVFKAAGYRLEDDDPVGVICDIQQGRPTDPAQFFLRDYLGSRHQTSPARTTRTFANEIEEFITKEVSDPQDKVDYDRALKLELNSNRPKINPAKFVQVNFKEQHQTAIIDRFDRAGVPKGAFDKDTSIMGRRPSRTKLTTSTGIKIDGPVAEMQERVEPSRDEDGNPIIIIKDTLTEAR